MTKADYPGEDIRFDEDRARMVARIAEAAHAHTIICVTESGPLRDTFWASQINTVS